MTEPDQYDDVLRGMTEGLLITINNDDSAHGRESGELRVRSSKAGETNVDLYGYSDGWCQIIRRDDTILWGHMCEDGLRRKSAVETIEIVGIRE
jgi:hypothetical protein